LISDELSVTAAVRLASPTDPDGTETTALVGAPPESARMALRRAAYGLALWDATCVVAALIASQGTMEPGMRIPAGFAITLAVAPVLWILVLASFGLYTLTHLSAWSEFKAMISAVGIGILLVMVTSPWWNHSMSRSAITWTWLVALGGEFVTRRLFRLRIGRLRRRGRLTMRTLIVGTNGEAEEVARSLSRRGHGFRPIGYVATSSSGPLADGIPVMGRIDELEEIIRREGADCVLVAPTAASRQDIFLVSQACRRANAEMRVSANLGDTLIPRVSIQRIDDLVTLALKPVQLTGPQAVLKRSFDLIVASVCLLLALPLLALIALAIRLSSPGPVLFHQQRVTKGGRLFTMHKFRTMVRDPERALESSVIDLTKPFFKMRDDPRLTSVGRLLRAASLDELPQLWNVIRGDMSLVGPRPLPAEQVEANPFLTPRHEVRGGITGWWQISGRSELDSEEALRLDLLYIENWSLGLDVYVLLRTLGAVAAKKGAW
jgi:exopolysaccharide biosynthesis polyprenyl glycosylphosphotransferase